MTASWEFLSIPATFDIIRNFQQKIILPGGHGENGK
jgi:hypothetical protein